MLEVNHLAIEEERQTFAGDRQVLEAVRWLREARRLEDAGRLLSGLAVLGVADWQEGVAVWPMTSAVRRLRANQISRAVVSVSPVTSVVFLQPDLRINISEVVGVAGAVDKVDTRESQS